MPSLIRERAQLRARHQLTLPDAVVRAVGVSEGDIFVVEVDPDQPETVRLERLRPSYAGALEGIYGDTREYLDELRREWE